MYKQVRDRTSILLMKYWAHIKVIKEWTIERLQKSITTLGRNEKLYAHL